MTYDLLPPCVAISISSVAMLDSAGAVAFRPNPTGAALFIVDELAPGHFRYWLQVCATNPRHPDRSLGRWLARRLPRSRIAVGRDLAGTISPTLRIAASTLAPAKAQRLNDRVSALIGEDAVICRGDARDTAFADLHARAGRVGVRLTNVERTRAWMTGDALPIQRELAHEAVMSWAAWANATRATLSTHADVVADALLDQRPDARFGRHDFRHGAAGIIGSIRSRPAILKRHVVVNGRISIRKDERATSVRQNMGS